MQKLSEKGVMGGFAVALLLLGGVGAEPYVQVQKLNENRSLVEQTHEVLESIYRVLGCVEDAGRERRIYILSNGQDVAARAEFQDSVEKTDRAIAKIRQLTQNNFEQQRTLNTLEPLVAKRLTLLQKSLQLVQQNQSSQIAQTAISQQSSSLQQKIESTLQIMTANERALLAQHSLITDASVRRAIWVDGIGTLLGVSLLIGVFYELQKQIREAKRDEVVRRHAEVALHQANEQWETRVQARTAELAQVNTSLQAELMERKLTERALADSEKQLHLVSNALPVLISYLDAEQRYRFNNRTYEEWFGASQKDLTGKHLRDVVGESAYQTIQPHAEAVLAGQKVDYEVEMPYRDGGTRWVHAIYIPDFGDGGEVKGYFALISDIAEAKRHEAERQQTEAHIRHSEERLHRILQNMPVMLDAFDENWNIIEWNCECERVTGYRADEVVGNPKIMELLYPNAEYRQQMVQAWSDRGNNYRGWEWEITCKDGTLKTVSWSNISERYPIPGWTSWGVGVDVTDRKQAENQLRQSEQRLSLAIEGSGMATWDVDIQADTALWSEQHFKLLGYEPVPSGEVRLEQWRSRVHPEDRARIRQASIQAQQERSPYRIEHRIIRADTEAVIWVAAFGRVVYNEAGQAVRFVGILLDISEAKRDEVVRKATEQEVLQLNQSLNRQIKQLETLLEVIPIGIGIAHDRHCKTITVNPTFAKQLGIPPTINASLSAPPDVAPTFKVYQNGREMRPEELPMQVAATHGIEVIDMEVEVVHADGKVVTLLEYAAPLFDEQNQIIGCVGAFLDISDRKQAEQNLKQANQDLERYNDGMEDLVNAVQKLSVARTLETVMTIVKQAARKLTRSDGATFILREGDECYYAEEDVLSALWKGQRFPINDCISGWAMLHHEPVVISEIEHDPRIPQHLYQSTFVKSLAIVPIRTHAPIGAIGNYWATPHQPTREEIALLQMLADTAAVTMENVQVYTELEQRVQQRTTELNQANQDLIRSNQELEQFAYVASHDLQEPLRAIIGYTQLLAKDYPDQLNATEQQYIAYVVEGATRMQQLIQDLLEYSRVSTHDLVFNSTDCNNVLKRVLDNLQVAIAESNATITHDPLPTITADKTQLTQLLQNLIGNAIKFRREAPLHIHISATLHPTPHTSDYLFTIRDNGIGIKPRYFDRIFEIFKRLHTRREFPGTGMGLAICKKIVDRHNGRIWAESELGMGTTFYFTIPNPPLSHPPYGSPKPQLNRDSAD